MKDCIKIEELKMFLGTELQTKDGELTSLSCESDGITVAFIEDEIYWLNHVKPLVRPLSNLTDDEWHEVFKAGYGEIYNSDKIFNKGLYKKVDEKTFIVGKQSNDGVLLSFYTLSGFGSDMYFNELKAYSQLVKYHADIFNWIGRGLAGELKELS